MPLAMETRELGFVFVEPSKLMQAARIAGFRIVAGAHRRVVTATFAHVLIAYFPVDTDTTVVLIVYLDIELYLSVRSLSE
jgi:hypothetical protein